MGKLKKLFAAAAAVVLSFGAFAGGIGIWIGDVEVGDGTPPKDCGWTYKKSADIDVRLGFASLHDDEQERTITFTKPGEYWVSGKNTTGHVQIVIDADCTVVLEDLELCANRMDIVHCERDPVFANYFAYSRLYPAITVQPKRHATVAFSGERVTLDGSLTDIIVTSGSSLILDDWSGDHVEANEILVVNQGDLTLEQRFGSDVYCYNAGELTHFGTGKLSYNSEGFSYRLSKEPSKYGRYVETFLLNTYNYLEDELDDHINIKIPGKTEVIHLDCSKGSLDVRGNSTLYNPYPIQAKKIFFAGGTFEDKDELCDCPLRAEEITVASGKIYVRRSIEATNKISISGGTVRADGCISAPEVEISGGEVSANGEWGRLATIPGTSTRCWWITSSGSNPRPAIGQDKGYVKISGGVVRANKNNVSSNLPLYLNGGLSGDRPKLTTAWQIRGCAGIGGNGTTVLITDGEIHAKGGGESISDVGFRVSGAAIGGSMQGDSGPIRILGGVVHAEGGYYACGIGPGTAGTSASKIAIEGGKVWATGGFQCPGIYEGGTISGGTIVAESGDISGLTDVSDVSAYHADEYLRATVVTGGSLQGQVYPMVVDSADNVCHCVSLYAASGNKAEIKGLPSKYKDVYFSTAPYGGSIYLWLPDGDYTFSVNGEKYTATVAGADTKAVNCGMCTYKVTCDANGGTVNGEIIYEKSVQHGVSLGNLPEPVREGYVFLGWRWRSEEEYVSSTEKVTCDMALSAHWKSCEKAAEEQSAASSQDPNVPCAVIHFHALDGIFEDYDTDELCYKYPLGLSYDWLPTPTANTPGQQLYCWFDLDAGEIVEADDIVTESRTLYACYYTPKVKTVYFYDLEFQQGPCYEVEVGCSAYLPAPRTKTGYTFAGWFSEENGGGKKFVNGKAPTSSDTAFYAYWQKNAEPEAPEPVVWTQNRYGCAELSTLGVDLPDDVSTIKKVTIEGAVKDLKLVQDKAKTKWYLEGVPKETLDGKTRTMAARIAFKEKGKADSVQTLLLSIVADKHTTAQMNLNAVYVKDAAEIFGVAAFDANWDVTGLAANLKFAKKATTWKDSFKTFHDIPAYAIYGQPNKLCAMTLVGKRKVPSEVPDSKTTHVELYSAEVLVRPESGLYDRMVKLNAQEETVYDVAADFAWATDSKTKASTPPSGLKFTNKDTKSGKTTIPAGSFYGKPTKTGYFPVTLTGPNNQTANYLVWVVDPEAPDVGCYFGSASKKLAKKVKTGGSAEEQTQKLELMVGASFDFPLIVSEGATVKQTGLPTGLKLAQDKTTKRWTIAGVPTKAGTYYATVTATKNGAATTVSYLFEVLPNAFAGEWRGYLFSAGESQAWRRHLAGLTVNIAAGGATKVTLVEKGTSASYSLKSFTWDDLNGNASISFTTKATKDYPIVREVTLELVDQGGWYALRGDVYYQVSGEYAGYAEAYPVVSVAELNERSILSGLAPTYDWIFTEDKNENGNIRQVAVLSTALDAKKGVAKVAGLLGGKNGGNETKLAVASLPIVRLGEGADDRASYAFAPFTAYDKVSNTTTLFTLALDGSDFDVVYDIRDELLIGRDTIACTAVEALAAGKPIADSLSASGLVLCDFYTHSSACFKIAATGKGKFEVYDTQGNKLAALSAKFGKDGLGIISFTTADKLCKYTLTVFDCGNGTLTGSVTLAEKSDGTTYTYIGLVDIY